MCLMLHPRVLSKSVDTLSLLCVDSELLSMQSTNVLFTCWEWSLGDKPSDLDFPWVLSFQPGFSVSPNYVPGGCH